MYAQLIEGGTTPDKRTEMDRIVTDEMLPALETTVSCLPDDRPRYLMGVGDPVGLVEAVARGVDLFDCVLPTRLARHGTVLTGGGRLNLRNRRFAEDAGPLDEACGCPVCGCT